MCCCGYDWPDVIHLLFNANSFPLLDMVNQARKQCGSRLYANNKFIEKIIDELDGETYTKSVGRKNGAEIEIAEMSIKQVT